MRKLWRSNVRGKSPNFFWTSSERSKRMRSASSLNLSPMYFSTCGLLTMVRLTFFLIGRPVSLLAKRKISSTERKSSLASAGVIWWILSTGSTSTRLRDGLLDGAGWTACGVGDGCGVCEGGAAGGDDCGVDGVVCANPTGSNNKKM